MTLRVSAEEALLVEAAAGRAVVLPAPSMDRIDWDRAVSMASWHRLLPLLWDHVRRSDGAIVPPDDVLAALRICARDTAARNLHLQLELDRVLGVLADAAIPVVLLKGAALVEDVYPDAGLRPMTDLDLLVAVDDVQPAQDALLGLGYGAGGDRVDSDDGRRLATMHHHFPLVKPGGSVVIEIHQGLILDRPGYDVAGIQARARVSARPPRHLLPAPEDMLVHVGVHFATDRIRRVPAALGQIADVVRIIGHWDLDWDAVVERSRQNQVADRLFLALDAAERLTGDLVPGPVLDALRPDRHSDARSEAFLRQRVLAAGPSLQLEQLAEGVRRLVPKTRNLEKYVRPSDATVPSAPRLHARRVARLGGRLVHEIPSPRRLVADIRLSRWIVSLRR